MAKKEKTNAVAASNEDKVLINVEVPRDLREAANKKAKDDGTTLAAVIRATLQSYVAGELVFESKITSKQS